VLENTTARPTDGVTSLFQVVLQVGGAKYADFLLENACCRDLSHAIFAHVKGKGLQMSRLIQFEARGTLDFRTTEWFPRVAYRS